MASEGFNRVMNDQQLKDHWIRRGIAYIIDSIIVFGVGFFLLIIGIIFFIGSAAGGAMSGNPVGGFVGGLIIFLIFLLIAFLFSIAYWIYFDAKGGTPGKRIMRLKPVALEGEMDYAKALIRNLPKIVGAFLAWFLLGLLIGTIVEVIFVALNAYMGISKGEDPRRKYTDFMAGTTVVRTDVQETFAPIPTTPPAPMPGAPATSETPVSSAVEPVPATSTVTEAQANQARLHALRDKFLLGEITEEQYLKERRNISGAS
jgi:uncharacterized RDD family membrane protein YckC